MAQSVSKALDPIDPPPPQSGDNIRAVSIQTRLSETYETLFADVEALAARANVAPKKIVGINDFALVGLLVRDAREISRRADKARVEEKAPYLDAGREVDVVFRAGIARMDRIAAAFEGIASAYQKEQAAERQRQANAAAALARAEEQKRLDAARKAEEAGRTKTAIAHAEKATKASDAAAAAEQTAASTSAALAPAQTFESGVKSTARVEWVGEIEDWDALDLNALRPYLKRDAVEIALRLAVKMGVRKVAGAKIEESVRASFR